jgi:hypothetical protein
MSQVQATPEMMAAWHAALPKLLRLNPQAAGQLNPNQFPSEAQIDQMQAGLGVHAKALEEAETLAKTQEAAGKGAVDNAEAGLKQIQLNLAKNSTPGSFDQQIDGIYPPNNAQNAGMNAMLKGQINASLSRGDVDTAKKFIASALDTVQSMNKEKAMATDPAIQQAKLQLSTAQKVAEQAISDGDPKAAAKLLIDGTVAPSQIISSRKPAFAQQAFTAAEQMQPGWSATKADADYNVAKSPENIRFFGSAKSLTDPGGTLDQLAAAAKDIPANQIPVFNSVADAVKASTGSGPIAKYAALALGVADDYSKVMGGGQGSDTSRTQALNLVASKQSPEQRAASIEGIRGAVGSQTTSRVGNNPVLQKMYGSNLPKQNSPAPTGKSVSLAAARQLPQNQGKSDAEITKDIEQYGHTVVP